jgi:hypothetical protein
MVASLAGCSHDPQPSFLGPNPLAINFGNRQTIQLPEPKEIGFQSSQVLNDSKITNIKGDILSISVNTAQPLGLPEIVKTMAKTVSFINQAALVRRQSSFYYYADSKNSKQIGELVIQEGSTVIDIKYSGQVSPQVLLNWFKNVVMGYEITGPSIKV